MVQWRRQDLARGGAQNEIEITSVTRIIITRNRLPRPVGMTSPPVTRGVTGVAVTVTVTVTPVTVTGLIAGYAQEVSSRRKDRRKRTHCKKYVGLKCTRHA